MIVGKVPGKNNVLLCSVNDWLIVKCHQVGPWKNPPVVRDEGSLFPLIRSKTHSFQIIPDYSRKVYILPHLNSTKLWKGGTRRLTLGTCQIQVPFQMHNTKVLDCPIPEQENMFLAMALDTYRIKDGAGQVVVKMEPELAFYKITIWPNESSPNYQEHPNNKQLPAKRLGWAALRYLPISNFKTTWQH